ncbi:zincin-like metallopeptidase domain-containing protein [Neobacillus niacini]|uniref:ArdC family protein n=1 Tax=Neobacillus niacini TaxID=86668 RepID=UPI002FFDE663
MAKKKFDIYETVTNRIIEKLEQGVVPWVKGWKNGGAVSWKTQKSYRGINTMLLDEGEWATFKQISEAGGKVKKGEKSSMCVFWKLLEKEDDNGEKENIPLLRFYNVFEINRQVEGLQSKRETETFEHDPIEKCEEVVKGYMDSPDITYERKGAWYKPGLDIVNVPPMNDFTKVEEFYGTLYHELIHSTGHKSRLNREGVTGTIKFGSQTYSKEELIAEIGSSFLCNYSGIDNVTIDNSASYIQSWLRVLKEDKTFVVSAAQRAQKAADMVLGVKWSD